VRVAGGGKLGMWLVEVVRGDVCGCREFEVVATCSSVLSRRRDAIL